nr:MAG TPA: hypothetical protein [Caudoviricetes sp.]
MFQTVNAFDDFQYFTSCLLYFLTFQLFSPPVLL